MGIRLGSLRANLRRENDGDWVAIPDFAPLELKVRGFNYGPYVAAKGIVDARNARRYFSKGENVPPLQAFQNNARLYLDHILIDWRGLDDDDGNPIPIDRAEEILMDPAYRELHESIRYAGQKISEINAELIEAAAKNSERSSAGNAAAGQ